MTPAIHKMDLTRGRFNVLIEVVPPVGADAEPLLSILNTLDELEFHGFSVATNPVARPRMSAMALCALIQQTTGRTAILHCTTRDHNRLSLQSELWGAGALGIPTVMAATGDMVALKERNITTTVRDLDVFSLVRMARDSGLQTGVVLDLHSEISGLKRAIDRLAQKVDAGAQYAVTQPIYDEKTADETAEAVRHIGIPVIMGILPLRTPRHAMFLHDKVAGIAVPQLLRDKMASAKDPIAQGVANARDMLLTARERFAGACVMPPFDHYEILPDIMNK
jgi:homocysteine S-methyltransferase